MSDKIDLYKLHRDEFKAVRKPTLIDVGEASYLAVAGRGDPGDDDFAAAIGALYAMAYTIKMTRKFEGGRDYVVCKLQCQWWIDGGASFEDTPRDAWNWRMMIRTPKFVAEAERATAAANLIEKGKGEGVDDVELISFTEGACVQMLHVGPYELEHETLSAMRDFAGGESLEPHGRHHEVYLSDPRRVAPEKLRTILRMPVRSMG